MNYFIYTSHQTRLRDIEYTFRLNLLHMWQDLKNGEHYLALFYFVLEYITLAKNNDPGRTRNCLNVPF